MLIPNSNPDWQDVTRHNIDRMFPLEIRTCVAFSNRDVILWPFSFHSRVLKDVAQSLSQNDHGCCQAVGQLLQRMSFEFVH